ncbi:MAG TPA: cation:dicarboxylase symporter family transporter, partial [Candidatus Binatia bacterium]|nr:cation:dicarboxylase symporter family transporter [Candidatus Binatia bacterium]
MKLHTRILFGLLAGLALGTLLAWLKLGSFAAYLKPVGDVFIKLLKMITIPLIMVSIMGASAGFSDLKKLKRIAFKTIAFFLVSTILAVSMGILAADAFQPGQGLDAAKKQAILADSEGNADWQKQLAAGAAAQKKTVAAFLLELIPANPFTALAAGDMLGVITFSLLLGLALTLIDPGKKQKITDLLDAANDALIVLVKGVMKLAPWAVFTLITAAIAQFGFHFLWSLLGYCLLTIGVMAVFLFAYYSLAILVLGRFNPIAFFKAMSSVGL